MLKALNIVGARPNLMKMAPVIAEMRLRPDCFEPILVHTGQHYDESMSGAFFEELGIPAPDINLGVGSGSHAEQTGRIMIALQEVMSEIKPDWVIVAGDVNSTMAAALVAVKLHIPVAHVEAGLRSRDRGMPEEINRIVTDAVADLLLTPSRDADRNLINEGVDPEKICFVGNVMIDTLHRNLSRANDSTILDRLVLQRGKYCAMTLHRPSNVDDKEILAGVLSAISAIQERIPVVFSVHPRTRNRLEEFGLTAMLRSMEKLILTEPLGYLDFLQLYSNSRLVLTDSGGIQEETTALGIPCITLRENTERPITVTEGTNRLAGSDPEVIKREVFAILDGITPAGRIPELWDGHAAVRIVDAIERA
ncbi:MAG: UDP-N-acetylglucosamine 2-epimerase (non-hydrolyzing) [Blastocatellia bacterium AA13]|nr:MAG: UDP-N-acetylglucosamine 2-epimerase (non-hydrolyzing) [Blastocatellia bacterium AA13]